MKLKDRIKEFRRVPAHELQPNPKNWRTHPTAQQDALRGVLAEVGIAGAVLARETAEGGLMLIDGHLRTDVMHDQAIPVLVLDVDEAEADKLLATIDPLVAMAEADADKLRELLEEVETASEALADMFTDLAEEAGMFEANDAVPPELADGDREPFRQMTFTVHDDQHAVIESAIKKAKANGGDESEVNENTNGNSLAFICEAYLNGNG